MTQVNWDKVKLRCSSLGVLFIEPLTKTAREAGELSETAKTHLLDVYIQEYWGRKKDIVTKAMEKGILAEQSGIELLSMVDGTIYEKNQERKENEWVTGHADIVGEEYLDDLKLSWSADSFMKNLIKPLDKIYYYQLQAYMWLWGKTKGRIRYALVDTPQSIIDNEKRRLLFSMDVATDENPEYKIAEAELVHSMTFKDIPIHERIIDKYVELDQEIISQIPDKVEKARKYLKFIHETHLKLN
jgi:hypothetical protein